MILVNAAELERADKFATPLLRGCYVRSHALLRRVVASRIGGDAASLRFERSCENCGHPAKFKDVNEIHFDMRPDKGKKMRRKLNAKQGIG